MSARTIAGWMLGSVPFSTAWLVAVNLPQGDPSPFLQAAAMLPQVVAITALLIQNAADAYHAGTDWASVVEGEHQVATAEAARRPVVRDQRRPVAAVSATPHADTRWSTIGGGR